MITVTEQGLEDVLRFKQKSSLILEYLPAKVVEDFSEKNALFFTSLLSSFANSNGGTIFIGVKSSRHIPQNIEPIPANSQCVDWLQMICKTQISPEIPNCIIKPIVVNAMGDFVVGIQIPNSHLAPHMSADNRFYKRSDCKITLLEEYEIRDLYTKGKRAEIELFSVTNTGGIPILAGGKFQMINFYPRFLVKNTGNCVEQFYKVELSVPTILNNPNFNSMADSFSRFDDGCSVYSVEGKTALFQGEIASIIEPNFVVNAESFSVFEQGDITLKFYYSSGVQTKVFHCKELLLYRNRQIKASDFVEVRELK